LQGRGGWSNLLARIGRLGTDFVCQVLCLAMISMDGQILAVLFGATGVQLLQCQTYGIMKILPFF
jgi:hypothetical protein